MPRITASGLTVLPFCAYPFRDDAPEVEDKPKPKTRAGSAVHTLNEWAVTKPTEPTAIDEAFAKHKVTPAFRQFVAKAHESWLDWWFSVGCPAFETEVAYEFNAVTRKARKLALPKPREYPYLDNCIYGTADAVLVFGDHVWVVDYKTGNPLFYAKAHDNAQMRFLAMCAAKVADLLDARVTLLFLDDVIAPAQNDAELESLKLAQFEESLCRRYSLIANAEPTRGRHCRENWCRLRPTSKFAGCPAWANYMAEETING
jgi:hypothetical protein